VEGWSVKDIQKVDNGVNLVGAKPFFCCMFVIFLVFSFSFLWSHWIGTIIPAGSSSFKVKLNEKLSRKGNSIILFRKDIAMDAFTGDYIEYDISENEIAFR
jgi:hypothetical protein